MVDAYSDRQKLDLRMNEFKLKLNQDCIPNAVKRKLNMIQIRKNLLRIRDSRSCLEAHDLPPRHEADLHFQRLTRTIFEHKDRKKVAFSKKPKLHQLALPSALDAYDEIFPTDRLSHASASLTKRVPAKHSFDTFLRTRDYTRD